MKFSFLDTAIIHPFPAFVKQKFLEFPHFLATLESPQGRAAS